MRLYRLRDLGLQYAFPGETRAWQRCRGVGIPRTLVISLSSYIYCICINSWESYFVVYQCYDSTQECTLSLFYIFKYTFPLLRFVIKFSNLYRVSLWCLPVTHIYYTASYARSIAFYCDYSYIFYCECLSPVPHQLWCLWTPEAAQCRVPPAQHSYSTTTCVCAAALHPHLRPCTSVIWNDSNCADLTSLLNILFCFFLSISGFSSILSSMR